MRSDTHPDFWAEYRRLPRKIRRQAKRAYALFAANPSHPGLEFKKVGNRQPVYSARVGIDYRVLGVLAGGGVVWFWIGPHHVYDRMLRKF